MGLFRILKESIEAIDFADNKLLSKLYKRGYRVYHLKDEYLGEGAQSTAYRITKKDNDNFDLVLKIADGNSQDYNWYKKAMQKRTSLKNIVKVYDILKSKKSSIVVMEYLPYNVHHKINKFNRKSILLAGEIFGTSHTLPEIIYNDDFIQMLSKYSEISTDNISDLFLEVSIYEKDEDGKTDVNEIKSILFSEEFRDVTHVYIGLFNGIRELVYELGIMPNDLHQGNWRLDANEEVKIFDPIYTFQSSDNITYEHPSE